MTRDSPEEPNARRRDRPSSRRQLSRRRLLQTGATGASITIAGCLGATAGSGGSESASGPGMDDATKEQLLAVGLAARESVVVVNTGTGWKVEDGVVLTCSHVVGSDVATVETFDGRTTEGSVIGRHDELDLALVDVDLEEVPTLPLASPGSLDEGAEWLLQVGHPSAMGTWVVSAGRFERERATGFLADLPCGPGSSGSPLLNRAGNVVGTATGTTVEVVDRAEYDRPETVFEEFSGQRLFATAKSVETIEGCLEQIL